jgi:hypothetical protein
MWTPYGARKKQFDGFVQMAGGHQDKNEVEYLMVVVN